MEHAEDLLRAEPLEQLATLPAVLADAADTGLTMRGQPARRASSETPGPSPEPSIRMAQVRRPVCYRRSRTNSRRTGSLSASTMTTP